MTITTKDHVTGGVGERTEVGRYTLPHHNVRLLIGQRILGHVRLIDVPQDGNGRSYIVQTELERDGYGALKALVADYIRVGTERGEIPAATGPLDRYLEHLA